MNPKLPFSALWIVVVCAVTGGCKKEDAAPIPQPTVPTTPVTPPSLQTEAAVLESATSARIKGGLKTKGDEEIIELGICWGAATNPVIFDFRSGKLPMEYADPASFDVLATRLSTHTTFYARTYAKTAKNVYYGNEVTFTSLACENLDLPLPSVSDIDKVAEVLVGEWEKYYQYEQNTTQTSPGIFVHNDKNDYFCESRDKLIFKSDLSVSSVINGVTSDYGKYTLSFSPDNYFHIRTEKGQIDSNFSLMQNRLGLWNWRNVVALKIYDTAGSWYSKTR